MRTRGIRLAGILMVWAALAPSAARAQAGATGPPPRGGPEENARAGEAAALPPFPGGGPGGATADPAFTFLPLDDAARPLVVRGQADATGYAPPDVEVPIPTGSVWPHGFYVFGEYVLYRTNVPLQNQAVARRGFVDTDGNATGFVGFFEGSGEIALQTNQVRGPGTWQPGSRVGAGYRFDDGTAIDVTWMHLAKAMYSAVATPLPRIGALDQGLTNSFLFSPVFNFPTDFDGPTNRFPNINGGAVGIWNGASLMTIEFDQRFDEYEFHYRVPIFETQCWRSYGMITPSFVWYWERFKWFTEVQDVDGNAGPPFDATYTNIVSNRMYGTKIGIGNECYLGHGFSTSLDLQAGLYLDIVKERVKYERGSHHDLGPERKRSKTDFTAVPAGQATFNLWWYPYRGIQVKLGYDVQAFFNTIAAKHPIDFDYSAVNPGFNRAFRELDGLNLGVGFSF